MAINLIQQIEEALHQAECTQTLVAFQNDTRIQEAKNDIKPGAKRFLINQFFNVVLLKQPASTQVERRSLIPDGEDKEWLQLFKTRIVNKIKTLES
jgi:cell division protein YceG involved in septum cleavage